MSKYTVLRCEFVDRLRRVQRTTKEGIDTISSYCKDLDLNSQDAFRLSQGRTLLRKATVRLSVHASVMPQQAMSSMWSIRHK